MPKKKGRRKNSVGEGQGLFLLLKDNFQMADGVTKDKTIIAFKEDIT